MAQLSADAAAALQVGVPLKASSPLYRSMFLDNVMFMYMGLVTSDLVSHVLEIMEDRLEEDRNDRRFSKKVYNVLVECLTNVYVDENSQSLPGYDPTSLLMVRKVDQRYLVITGSHISAQREEELRTALEKINSLDTDGLKAYHKEVLITEDPSLAGITTLGLIDLARKSKNPLNFEFSHHTGTSVFFSLETTIHHGSV